MNLLTKLGETVNPDETIFQLNKKIEATAIFRDNLRMVRDAKNPGIL